MPGLLDMLSETWPARLAQDIWSGITLPRDVYQGKVDPMSPEGIARVNSLAGLMMGGTFGGAPAGALGVGPVRRSAASLPMDEASRMARGQAMGFRTQMPLAHGTSSTFDAFDLTKGGSTIGTEPARMGVWSEVRRGESQIADEFAEMSARNTGGNPQVMPLLHRADKPAALTLSGSETNEEIAATLAHAWENGYDAVMMRNYTSPGGKRGDILVVKDPSQLRSVFAQFDPAKRDSANLLAGMASAVALPAALWGGLGPSSGGR
mgnify:CR=1 FL=1